MARSKNLVAQCNAMLTQLKIYWLRLACLQKKYLGSMQLYCCCNGLPALPLPLSSMHSASKKNLKCNFLSENIRNLHFRRQIAWRKCQKHYLILFYVHICTYIIALFKYLSAQWTMQRTQKPWQQKCTQKYVPDIGSGLPNQGGQQEFYIGVADIRSL